MMKQTDRISTKRMKNTNQGQILLLVLMVMGVALTLGLTASVRSLGGLLLSQNSQESVSCQVAIESGIENILAQLANTATANGVALCSASKLRDSTWDNSGTLETNMQVCDLETNTCGNSAQFSDPTMDFAACVAKEKDQSDWTDVTVDLAVQIPLRELNVSAPASVDVHWLDDSTTFPLATPEVTIYGRNNSSNVVEKLFYNITDPDTADSCHTGSLGSLQASTVFTGGKMINIVVPGTSGSYASDIMMLRVRFLCDGVKNLRVIGRSCAGLGCSGSNVDLPAQYYRIRSVCLNKPVTREIEVQRTFGELPALFEYNLYSGSKTDPVQ